MPKHYREDHLPIIQFDAQSEVSPFLVFRRLKDGEDLRLVDVRNPKGSPTLRGSETWSEGWTPPSDQDVLLFDDDGSQAVPLVRDYLAKGFFRVRALFGGLELWTFALDPKVVGEDTFLEDEPD